MNVAFEPVAAKYCTAILAYATKLAAALVAVPDPSKRAVGHWNIAETATHVSHSSSYFLAAARGEADLEDLDENAATTTRAVAQDRERRLPILAERILTGERALVEFARNTPGDPPVTPFQGVTIPLSAMLGIELGELIVHGFDITRAAGMPWEIRPEDAALALQGLGQLLPAMLDTRKAGNLHMTCDLRVRHGQPVLITIADGAMQVEAPNAQPVDCHASVDPRKFLLLSFNRINPVMTLLSGGLLLWGRKPWRFLTLQTVLKHA